MVNMWNSTFQAKKRSAIKRVPFKRTTSLKAKRKTKTSIWADYGLERPAYVRYSGKKGVYWWLLSRKVRQQDFKRWGGKCVNCNKQLPSWQDGQCGHYLSAEKCGFLLLFDELNLALECKGCNKYDKQKLGYEQNLDKRYGEGTVFGLKKRYWESKKGTPAHEWSQLEYDRKIRALQAELAKLEYATKTL